MTVERIRPGHGDGREAGAYGSGRTYADRYTSDPGAVPWGITIDLHLSSWRVARDGQAKYVTDHHRETLQTATEP